MPIEWDTLVLEAHKKAREVNPRACILTDVDVVLAMAGEIDRLWVVNAKLTEAIVHVVAAWEAGIERKDISLLRLALAAAEASAAPPSVPAPADPPDRPLTADRSAPRTPARPPRA